MVAPTIPLPNGASRFLAMPRELQDKVYERLLVATVSSELNPYPSCFDYRVPWYTNPCLAILGVS